MAERRTKYRGIRFDQPTDDAITAIAEVEGRSWSDVVRRLVAEALAARWNGKAAPNEQQQ